MVTNSSVVVRDVRYSYGQFEALRGITASLSGGITVLLGPNGAGKTTLLRLLVTITTPSSGKVELFGHSLTRRKLRVARRQLGYMPQMFSWPGRVRVGDFLNYCAWLHEMPKVERAEAVATALADVDLEEVSRQRLQALSGGMLRRVALAQAIVHDPRLLVLDEPTAGLDPEQRIRFREFIMRALEGRTVILSTHLTEDVGPLADRVLVLSSGRLCFDGTVTELEQQGNSEYPGATELERGFTAVLARARA